MISRRYTTPAALLPATFALLATTACDGGAVDPDRDQRIDNEIVFVGDSIDASHLYRIRPNGSGLRKLTSGSAWDEDARISPDGRRIAFIRREGIVRQVWVMNADGSNERQVTHDETSKSRLVDP